MTGKIDTVGVIGAGQMGSGIAQVSAIAGFKVLLYDLSTDRIEKGLATISGNLVGNLTLIFRGFGLTPPRLTMF